VDEITKYVQGKVPGCTTLPYSEVHADNVVLVGGDLEEREQHL